MYKKKDNESKLTKFIYKKMIIVYKNKCLLKEKQIMKLDFQATQYRRKKIKKKNQDNPIISGFL